MNFDLPIVTLKIVEGVKAKDTEFMTPVTVRKKIR